MQMQRRGADSTHPPGAQTRHHQCAVSDSAGHADDTANDGQCDRLRKKLRADARLVEPDGLHEPDLRQPLLKAQLEEVPGQQHRGKYEERAEVREVLAESGWAL